MCRNRRSIRFVDRSRWYIEIPNDTVDACYYLEVALFGYKKNLNDGTVDIGSPSPK